MPMNTRSGASTATPAVASRATKTTQAKKTSKAKTRPSKANTTNRVQKPTQKPAPTRRNARGYVWIDKDSHTVDNDTFRTASPERNSDTPIPPRRVLPEPVTPLKAAPQW